MSEKDYDQNFYKMYCPRCDKKLVIENSAPGDIFNCPGCELEITIPDFIQEVKPAKESKPDPISLLT